AREEDIQNMAAFGMGIYQDMFDRICERYDDPKNYVREHPDDVIKVIFITAIKFPAIKILSALNL
ncbi:MAG: hypothetical protein IJQ82_11335, partial [Selenomonadaceae bacterium]|nr:hypothetical protein [Selenomonadaceae bacterium]